MFEFPAFLLPTNIGQPMHSPSALTEHVSLSLAGTFLLHPVSIVIFSANTHGEDLGDLALTIPLHKTRVEIEGSVCDYDGDIRREEDDTGNRSGFSPVSNISLEIVEGQSPSLPHMEK